MKQISHFKTGLFFLTSVVIITVGLFWVGAQGVFREAAMYVTYVDSSVQGLNTGSSIKYLGLKVGQIESMDLASQNQDLVQIVMALDPDFKVADDMAVSKAMEGVTGQSSLSIVQAPEDIHEITPAIDFDPPHPVIPSVPGRIARVENALSELYHEAKSLDVDGFLAEWKAVAQDTRKAVDHEQISSTLGTMHTAFEDISRLSGQMQEIASRLEDEKLTAALEDLQASSRSIRQIASSLEYRLEEIEPGTLARTSKKLNQTLDRTDSSIESVNVRIEESLRYFQQGMIRLDQVLVEIQNLARSLRTEPDRILNRTRSREPFKE
ncbi:MAG: MlaD family protein [Desulfovermiculus sp.]